MDQLSRFRRIFVVDTEYHHADASGELVRPICICARELRSGETVVQWLWNQNVAVSPVPCGDNDLFVCYSAMAEFSVYTALGWGMPVNVLDLLVEHRTETNGVAPPGHTKLLDAMRYHGVIDGPEYDRRKVLKDEMRGFCIRGQADEVQRNRSEISAYCLRDVEDTAALLRAMVPVIDIDRACYRGAYLRALAPVESAGIPLDPLRLEILRNRWDGVRQHLAELANLRYPRVYHPGTCSFNERGFTRYLQRVGIHDWPRLPSGALKLDSDAWHEQVESYPLLLSRLHQYHSTIGKMRTVTLAVGADGRNRTGLRPFSSKCGRNQPSNSEHIFGCAKWLRGLIHAKPDSALAYLDFAQQEFGIAASLSGDVAMQDAYRSGDPYLKFGKQIGLIPPEGTKKTHEEERNICKRCIMGIQYIMGPRSLGKRVGREEAYGRVLLTQHRRAYPEYWRWSDRVVAAGHFDRALYSTFGWPLHVFAGTKDRTLANFPMQSNGAEILRLSIILAANRGVRVIAPVHDALLIEGDAACMDSAITTAKSAMTEASRIVLKGFALRVDSSDPIIGRFTNLKDGQEVWDQVWAYLGLPP